MITKHPFTILSAELYYYNSKTNSLRTKELGKLLQEHFPDRFLKVFGKYREETEQSFIVVHRDGTAGKDWQKLLDFAERFNQECVLHVGSDRQGLLYDSYRHSITELGKWREVHPSIAKSKDAYTLINGKYYLCG